MNEASQKMMDLAKDYLAVAEKIEAGEITLEGTSKERVESLVKTYQWWARALHMAAWLYDECLKDEKPAEGS